MSRKTQALYMKVFQLLLELVHQLKSVRVVVPTCAMVDFEEASVSPFQHMFPEAAAAGCWFHYVQSLTKHLNKLGVKEA